jgi:hypothetical protein
MGGVPRTGVHLHKAPLYGFGTPLAMISALRPACYPVSVCSRRQPDAA